MRDAVPVNIGCPPPPGRSSSQPSLFGRSLSKLAQKAKGLPALPSLRIMKRILVTGMSGTGKSSALERLELLGFRTVDTDDGDWTEWSEAEGGYVWREERIAELLSGDEGPSLYISGTVSNQGRFFDRFEAVVLLSAPANVLLSRIGARTTNPMGRPPRNGGSCSATWRRLSRFYVGHALMRSTPVRRSQTSSPGSRNSVAALPPRSTSGSPAGAG